MFSMLNSLGGIIYLHMLFDDTNSTDIHIN
jgi:hypothetical protein